MLFEEKTYYRLCYIFTNNISAINPIYEGLTLPTGILCKTYQEAATQVNTLIRYGIFQQASLNLGFVYDCDHKMIEEINWGKLLEESIHNNEEITIH